MGMLPAKHLRFVSLVGACLCALVSPARGAAGPDVPVTHVLANRDDDDRDGRPDADDERVNGEADGRDVVPLPIVPPKGATAVRVEAAGAPLRFFLRQGDAWTCLGVGGGAIDWKAGEADPEPTLCVEATAWAGLPAAWTGTTVIRVRFEATDGPPTEHEVEVRVAPVTLRPATATVDAVYVATGRYDNASFLESLRDILGPLDVPLVVHATRDWREMWMQDTMEVAVAATDRGSMHVVLAGLRNADTFPPTLLGPDIAVAEVAHARSIGGGDAWADWYGNLEVSPPTAAHPHGRVIHGRNRLTGTSFHPDVVAFLSAQRTQPPVWIDTSWLLIKHVDEIVAFLPGPDGQGVVVVPDPIEGMRLLGDTGSPKADLERRREANTRIARAIDAMLEGDGQRPLAGAADGSAGDGLLALLDLDESRVVRLPVAFDVPAAGLLDDGGVTNASSLWSNPVNALVVNGTVICGSAGMTAEIRAICRQRFLEAGADRVEFIDDGVYQKNHGNVHCATNAKRRGVAKAGQ
jgi:protein-arginine deiminase